MQKQKKPQSKSSEVMLRKIEDMMRRCPNLAKDAKTMLASIKANAEAIDARSASETFKAMVKKRQAAKYYGVSKADFETKMKELVEREKELFTIAQTLTAADMKAIETIKAKTVATREANKVKELLKEDEE